MLLCVSALRFFFSNARFRNEKEFTDDAHARRTDACFRFCQGSFSAAAGSPDSRRLRKSLHRRPPGYLRRQIRRQKRAANERSSPLASFHRARGNAGGRGPQLQTLPQSKEQGSDRGRGGGGLSKSETKIFAHELGRT